MKELDTKEFDNWKTIQQRGFLLYMIKWVLYSVCYFLLIYLFLLLINSTQESSLFAAMAVAIPFGIVISVMRWKIMNKRYKGSID